MNNFLHRFMEVCNEVMGKKHIELLELTYGFTSGKFHSLEESAYVLEIHIDKAKEQIEDSIGRVRNKGRYHLKRNELTVAAVFMNELDQELRPDEEHVVERISDFIAQHLSYLPLETHSIPFMVFLLFRSIEKRNQILKELLEKTTHLDNNFPTKKESGFEFQVQTFDYDNQDFGELLYLALDSLGEREKHIFKLRYGFDTEEPATLQEIADELGVTGERIRQLINRSIRRIGIRGRSQIKRGSYNEPCAQLISYLDHVIGPNETEEVAKISHFVCDALAHLPLRLATSLICRLYYRSKDVVSRKIAEVQENIQRSDTELKASGEYQGVKSNPIIWSKVDLLSGIWWPKRVNVFKKEDLDNIRSKRRVATDVNDRITGSFYSEKMKKEVFYESSLERDFLTFLERSNEVIYYREQPVRIKYVIDETERFYTPDVLFSLHDGRVVLAEIKPALHMVSNVNLVKSRVLYKYCEEHGLGCLITDGRRTLTNMRLREGNSKFEESLLEALNKKRKLGSREFKKIREKYNATESDVVHAVLKYKLDLRFYYFSIRLAEE